MASLPEQTKYNPLEDDDGEWVPVRGQSMNKETRKDCILCKHASFVLYLVFTVAAHNAGYITSYGWLFVQLLLGLYVHIGSIKKSR